MSKPKPKPRHTPKPKPRHTPKPKDPQLVERLYTTGMQLADCLRLLGERELAHETEVWILALVQEMKS